MMVQAPPFCRRRMSRANDDADGRKIFVGGLPFSVDEHAIREDFGKFGEIEDVYLPRDKEHDRPRGFGFVTYKDTRDAEDAAKDWNGCALPQLRNGQTPHMLQPNVDDNSEGWAMC